MNNVEQLLQRAYEAHQAGRLDDAERLYRELLAIAPDDLDGCNLLGLLCLESGRPEESIAPLKNAIRLRPDDPQAHYNLGIAHKEMAEFDKAAEQFRDVMQLSPDNTDASIALANVLRADHKLDEAKRAFDVALQLDPKHTGAKQGMSDTLNEIAVAKNKLGHTDEAIEMLQEAVSLHSGNAEAQMNLGIILEQAGEPDAAASAVRAAISAKPDFASAHYQLAHLRDHESTDDEIAAMQSLFDRGELKRKDLARLAYGIGKVLEKRGEYEHEFNWLKKAHALMSGETAFDSRKQAQYVDSQIKRFKKITPVPGAENLPGTQNIIFVTGMPRSGTTLTEQILASHPDVHGSGEHSMVAETAVHVMTEGITNPQAMLAVGMNLAEGLAKLADGARFVVETTPTNFFHIGLIATLLPRARIVHCIRQPLDTCLSIYQHPLSQAHAYAHDFDDLSSYYLTQQRLMDHWQDALPGRIHYQRYEDTVDDLDSNVRSLLSFCGIGFHPACLEFHKTERTIRTPSASQVRQPIYGSSVGRWKRYAEQLAPLKDKLEHGLGVSFD
jgi:tetratricopeptide (TPR) repeat protein